MQSQLHNLTFILLVLVGLSIGPQTPALADDSYTMFIDCYHSDLDKGGSPDPVHVEAYRNGKLLTHEYNYIGPKNYASAGCGDMDNDPYFWFQASQLPDEIRIHATSDDAVIIDEADSDLGHWGVDNGNAWCLSTDPNDNSSQSNKLAFGKCVPCVSFRTNGSWGRCPMTKSYQLYHADGGTSSSINLSSINTYMDAAEDIAAVDHDGDGIDEIAALINIDGIQRVLLYEADLSGNFVGYWIPTLNSVLAIAGVDHDGDGVDEIAVLQDDGGNRKITLYDAPIGVQMTRIAVSATTVVNGDTVDIAGVDYNGDGIDEIAMLRNDVDDSKDLTLVLRTAPWFSLPTILLQINTGALPDDGSYSITGIDHDGDGADEVGVMKVHYDDAGQPIFELYPVNGQSKSDKIYAGFQGIAGNRTFVIAGIDHDGDGIDSVAVIRH